MSTATGRKALYPWASLEVGDGFAVPQDKATTIHSAGIQWSKRHGLTMKFSVKKSAGEEGPVFMIKRVA